jgi:hypothetical protein
MALHLEVRAVFIFDDLALGPLFEEITGRFGGERGGIRVVSDTGLADEFDWAGRRRRRTHGVLAVNASDAAAEGLELLLEIWLGVWHLARFAFSLPV